MGLIIQHENSNPCETTGLYLGFEFAQEGDAYVFRLHARQYDGIRVASKHSTPWVSLGAKEEDPARIEAAALWRDWQKMYRGTVVPTETVDVRKGLL